MTSHFQGPPIPPLPVPEDDPNVPPACIKQEVSPIMHVLQDIVGELRVERCFLDDICAYTYYSKDLAAIVKPYYLNFRSAMTDPKTCQVQFWYMVCAPVIWELYFRAGKLTASSRTHMADFAFPAWAVELPIFDHWKLDGGWSSRVLKTLIYTDDSEFEFMATNIYRVMRCVGLEIMQEMAIMPTSCLENRHRR